MSVGFHPSTRPPRLGDRIQLKNRSEFAISVIAATLLGTFLLYHDSGYSAWVGSPPLTQPHGALDVQKM